MLPRPGYVRAQVEELVRNRKQRALLTGGGAPPAFAPAAPAVPGVSSASSVGGAAGGRRTPMEQSLSSPESPPSVGGVQTSGDSASSSSGGDIIRSAAEAIASTAQLTRAMDDLSASLPELTISDDSDIEPTSSPAARRTASATQTSSSSEACSGGELGSKRRRE